MKYFIAFLFFAGALGAAPENQVRFSGVSAENFKKYSEEQFMKKWTVTLTQTPRPTEGKIVGTPTVTATSTPTPTPDGK